MSTNFVGTQQISIAGSYGVVHDGGMSNWHDILRSSVPSHGYGVTQLKSGPAAYAAPVLSEPGIVDRGEMSVECVLTTRTRDRQGDIVEPRGCDDSDHRAVPVVLYHHGKDHHLPIGKAEDPAGNYTVRLVGDRLLGKTYFSQSDRFAADVFGLVAENILRGVSVGFDPVDDGPRQKSVEVLGDSPVLDRPAMRFKAWKLLEYSHTPIGVNPDAVTGIVRKALDGSRPCHPMLLKHLTPFAATRRATVTGGYSRVEKAMPQPEDDYDDPTAAETGVDTETVDDDQDQPESSGPTPSVKAMLDAAQGLDDLCEQISAAMDQSEHIGAKKYMAKVCKSVAKVKADIEEVAEKIQGELSGAVSTDDDEDGDTDADSDIDVGEDEAADKMAAVQKSLKDYQRKRWVFADLAAALPRGAGGKSDGGLAARVKALETENRDLKRENAAAAKEFRNLKSDLEAAGRLARR